MPEPAVKKLGKTDYHTLDWGGGATTEIAIAPTGAVYGERSFLWRVSSATVDAEESAFTALPDYDRIIMTLEGEMSLCHDGGKWRKLREFEPYSFDGAAGTVSRGKARDFNLMLRKGRCTGVLIPVLCREDEEISCTPLPAVPGLCEALVFCCGKTVSVHFPNGETEILEAGETLRLTGNFSEYNFTCEVRDGARAAIACVKESGQEMLSDDGTGKKENKKWEIN